jgi:hypothetical protein
MQWNTHQEGRLSIALAFSTSFSLWNRNQNKTRYAGHAIERRRPLPTTFFDLLYGGLFGTAHSDTTKEPIVVTFTFDARLCFFAFFFFVLHSFFHACMHACMRQATTTATASTYGKRRNLVVWDIVGIALLFHHFVYCCRWKWNIAVASVAVVAASRKVSNSKA